MTTEEIAKLANDTLTAESKLTQLRSWEESARKGEVAAKVEFSNKKFTRSQMSGWLSHHEIIAMIGNMILAQQSKLFQLEAQMKKLKEV